MLRNEGLGAETDLSGELLPQALWLHPLSIHVPVAMASSPDEIICFLQWRHRRDHSYDQES